MIVAHVPDLMDRSRVAAAFGDVRFVDDPADLAGAAVAVVDLTRPGVPDAAAAVAAAGGRVVAFAPHRETALLGAARAAGCDIVLARSAFFGRIRDVAAEVAADAG